MPIEKYYPLLVTQQSHKSMNDGLRDVYDKYVTFIVKNCTLQEFIAMALCQLTVESSAP